MLMLFILKLLKKDPSKRLGGGRLGAEEVKKHPYFNGVDWDAFMTKKVTPPWKPTIVRTSEFFLTGRFIY
jgi:hypothetical protein